MADRHPSNTGPASNGAAEVDFLVDERGYEVNVPDNSQAAATDNVRRSIGATGPSNWWRIGLAIMGLLILGILALQLFGGAPGTAVQPGTPVAAPASPAETPPAQP